MAGRNDGTDEIGDAFEHVEAYGAATGHAETKRVIETDRRRRIGRHGRKTGGRWCRKISETVFNALARQGPENEQRARGSGL